MALLKPHPALKVAAPESPMIDGWMGDDWFHYGAFRLANIGWIGSQTGYKGAGKAPPSGGSRTVRQFPDRFGRRLGEEVGLRPAAGLEPDGAAPRL
ncbi:CocE/NonD family hydrolase [Sphingomonas sp. MMS24-JH45]